MLIGKHNNPSPIHYEKLRKKKSRLSAKHYLLLLSNKVKLDFGEMLQLAIGEGFLTKHMQDYKKKAVTFWENESGISIYRAQSGSLSSRYQL